MWNPFKKEKKASNQLDMALCKAFFETYSHPKTKTEYRIVVNEILRIEGLLDKMDREEKQTEEMMTFIRLFSDFADMRMTELAVSAKVTSASDWSYAEASAKTMNKPFGDYLLEKARMPR